MRINISFNLSDAKILTVAKERGYSETVTSIVDPETFVEIPNPQTPDQFLQNVYTAMIKEDLKAKLLVNEETVDLIPRRILKEQQILTIVEDSFV